VEVKALSEQKSQACTEPLTKLAIIGPELILWGRDSADNDEIVARVWSRSQSKSVTVVLKAAPRMSDEEIGRLELTYEAGRGGD